LISGLKQLGISLAYCRVGSNPNPICMQLFATRSVWILVNNIQPVADAPIAPRRVLFVSGDADLRAVVERVLERAGYQVHAVAHSGHALLLCRTARFDLLIAELSGPDISGPALAEQVRRHCPGLTALYLGNLGTVDGVDNLLVRPFTKDDLLERIALALAGVAS
jgi:CheY-like chemotaxis protein